MNTASQIAASISREFDRCLDYQEAVSTAIDEELPDATDDYKANVYTLIVEHGVPVWSADIERFMELAD